MHLEMLICYFSLQIFNKFQNVSVKKKKKNCQVPVVPAYNPSYLGGLRLRGSWFQLAWADSLQDPISKITRAKWTGGVAQVVDCLL
jgi:hypothetical protein